MKTRDEPGLFDGGAPAPLLPDGFKYQPALISADDAQQLVGHVEALPFKEFEFHGYTGKRRVVSFGWRYDFDERIRDVVQGPDGLIYLLTDSSRGRILRVEPAQRRTSGSKPASTPAG